LRLTSWRSVLKSLAKSKTRMKISGLDSVEARRWINSTLIGRVDTDNSESLKPLIDSGTEGPSLKCPMSDPLTV
jgi:hypothetical protein